MPCGSAACAANPVHHFRAVIESHHLSTDSFRVTLTVTDASTHVQNQPVSGSLPHWLFDVSFGDGVTSEYESAAQVVARDKDAAHLALRTFVGKRYPDIRSLADPLPLSVFAQDALGPGMAVDQSEDGTVRLNAFRGLRTAPGWQGSLAIELLDRVEPLTTRQSNSDDPLPTALTDLLFGERAGDSHRGYALLDTAKIMHGVELIAGLGDPCWTVFDGAAAED